MSPRRQSGGPSSSPVARCQFPLHLAHGSTPLLHSPGVLNPRSRDTPARPMCSCMLPFAAQRRCEKLSLLRRVCKAPLQACVAMHETCTRAVQRSNQQREWAEGKRDAVMRPVGAACGAGTPGGKCVGAVAAHGLSEGSAQRGQLQCAAQCVRGMRPGRARSGHLPLHGRPRWGTPHALKAPWPP